MKRNAAEKLLQRVAESIAEWQPHVRGNLLLVTPVRDVLCGMLLESSGFSSAVFQPCAFAQPMFEKSSYLVLSYSERFPGNWSSDDEEVAERLVNQTKTIGHSVWEKYGSTEKLAALRPEPRMPHRAVTRGYALTLLRRFSEAEQSLKIATEQFIRIYGDPMKASPSFWPNSVHAELMQMLDKLRTDPEAAIRTLREWRQFTLGELELTGFAGEADATELA